MDTVIILIQSFSFIIIVHSFSVNTVTDVFCVCFETRMVL